jgi:hypothetical protein
MFDLRSPAFALKLPPQIQTLDYSIAGSNWIRSSRKKPISETLATTCSPSCFRRGIQQFDERGG